MTASHEPVYYDATGDVATGKGGSDPCFVLKSTYDDLLARLTAEREGVRKDALEEAAKVCDGMWATSSSLTISKCAGELARAIRSLSPAAVAVDEGWISVEERLPPSAKHGEAGHKVLVRLRVINSTETARLREDERGQFWRIADTRVSVESATHWRELPTAPSAHFAGKKSGA